MIYAACIGFLVGAGLRLAGRSVDHRNAGEVVATASAVFLIMLWGQW
ncbi:hypothetical protein [Streptomyces sp. OE57]